MLRSDLFNLNYYRQADFTGSRGGICYRLCLDESETEPRFLFQWWKGPFNSETTKETKRSKYFPYTIEGMDEICAFIDAMEENAPCGRLFEGEMIK